MIRSETMSFTIVCLYRIVQFKVLNLGRNKCHFLESGMASNEKIQAMLANRSSSDEERDALTAWEALQLLKGLLESALEARSSGGASDIK